jgi:uncharacterized RDD family membrane protein YckC
MGLKIVYPIFPMVLLIIIPFLNGYFFGNINPTFSDKAIWLIVGSISSRFQYVPVEWVDTGWATPQTWGPLSGGSTAGPC